MQSAAALSSTRVRRALGQRPRGAAGRTQRFLAAVSSAIFDVLLVLVFMKEKARQLKQYDQQPRARVARLGLRELLGAVRHVARLAARERHGES